MKKQKKVSGQVWLRSLLISADTLFNLGSNGHFPFPESTFPGSRRKMYSWKVGGKHAESTLMSLQCTLEVTLLITIFLNFVELSWFSYCQHGKTHKILNVL